jgi:hypothetical protein
MIVKVGMSRVGKRKQSNVEIRLLSHDEND